MVILSPIWLKIGIIGPVSMKAIGKIVLMNIFLKNVAKLAENVP